MIVVYYILCCLGMCVLYLYSNSMCMFTKLFILYLKENEHARCLPSRTQLAVIAEQSKNTLAKRSVCHLMLYNFVYRVSKNGIYIFLLGAIFTAE